MVPDDYSEHVLNLRKRLALTQVQFAKKFGVAFATINRWENRQTRPSRFVWDKIMELEKKEDQLAVDVGDITTATITKKVLDRLLNVAKDKKRTIENRKKSNFNNYYVDGRLFAGGSKDGGWYIVIRI